MEYKRLKTHTFKAWIPNPEGWPKEVKISLIHTTWGWEVSYNHLNLGYYENELEKALDQIRVYIKSWCYQGAIVGIVPQYKQQK